MPETPTKTGWYWVWLKTSAFPRWVIDYLHEADFLLAESYVTLGPRIPSSATLAALRELAAKDPLIDDDWGGGFPFCHYCGGVECGDGPDPDVPPYRIHHHADCPYPKAQEKRDE